MVLHPTSGSAAGLPDDKHVLFDVTTTATNQLPVDAGFNLAFTMRLTGVTGGKLYGLDNDAVNIYTDNTRTALGSAPVPFPTHVFMRAVVQGTIGSTRGFSSYPASSLVQSNPKFSQAQFRMFFDADGDPATTADQVAIAKFGTTAAPDPLSSMAGTTFIDQGVVNFLVNWDSALPGVFTNQGGFELATGVPDAAPDNALRRVSTATQVTGQADINFRFACAASGLCFVSTGNVLRMRLQTRGGGTVVPVVRRARNPRRPSVRRISRRRKPTPPASPSHFVRSHISGSWCCCWRSSWWLWSQFARFQHARSKRVLPATEVLDADERPKLCGREYKQKPFV